jgi:hypothetical protein
MAATMASSDELRGQPRAAPCPHTQFSVQMEHVMRKIMKINADLDQLAGQVITRADKKQERLPH